MYDFVCTIVYDLSRRLTLSNIRLCRWDWEQRYLHVNYSQSLDKSGEADQPCSDVYRFPIFTDQFCDEFIDEVETFGLWSDGTNNDARLEGGYEAVPTRDVHMNQIG